MQKKYPDITDLLEAKVRRRRKLAALSWEEKVEIIRQMQLLLPKGVWQVRTISNTSWQGSGSALRAGA